MRWTIFRTAISRKRPTPRPTVTISSVPFIIELTCSARTERSGSAMVINRPITKLTISRMLFFRLLVRPSPMNWPIGVMARSAPRLNRAMPAISNSAEMPNTVSSRPVRSIKGVK